MVQTVEKQVGSAYRQWVDMEVKKEVTLYTQLPIVEETVVLVVADAIKIEDTTEGQTVVTVSVGLTTLKV